MVRAKPSLFLTVPNALDADTYSRADLITPPCYIVSAPPPMLTPALSRSSSLSTNSSQSESDCEFEDDDEEEISLKTDAALWTVDQDEALLNVPLSLFVLTHYRHTLHIWIDHRCRLLPSRHLNHLPVSPPRSRAAQFAVMVGTAAQCHLHVGASLNWRETNTMEVRGTACI